MKCEVCGRGMAHGASLYRRNPVGVVPAVWRCQFHNNDVKVAPEVAELIAILESDKETKQ